MAGRWAGASIPLDGAPENHASMREPVPLLAGGWWWWKGLHISENHFPSSLAQTTFLSTFSHDASLSMSLLSQYFFYGE